MSGPPARAALTAADYEALAEFRRAMRRYFAFTEEGARSVGLTSQQHQALLAVKAHTLTKPMSIGDLAAHLLLKHHSAVELAGRLEKAGYLCRTPDPQDGRRVLVSLSEKGEDVLAQLSVRNLNELSRFAPMFAGLLDQLDQMSGE